MAESIIKMVYIFGFEEKAMDINVKLVLVACYGKWHFRARELPVRFWEHQTYTNKVCLKNFSRSCKKTPPKCNLLFALYIANPKKKFFSVFNFFYFFLQNLIAFGERIPKRYNTWVFRSCMQILVNFLHIFRTK